MRCRAWAAPFGIVALLAAGCSSDTSESSDGAGASASTDGSLAAADVECPAGRATETADELEPLRIASLPIAEVAVVVYAHRCGYLAKHGLDVTLETATGGSAAAGLMASGEADLAITAWQPISLAMSAGQPFVIAIDGAYFHDNGTSIVAAADSPISTARDLEGKRLGMNQRNGGSELTLRLWMESQGADFSTVEIIELPLPEQLPALDAGQLDAVSNFEPFSTIARTQGYKIVNDDQNSLVEGTNGGLIAMRPWAEANERAIRAARAAFAEVVELFESDEAALRAFLPSFTGIAPDIAAQIRLPRYVSTTEVDNIQPTIDNAFEVGMLPTRLDIGPLVVYPD